MSTATTLALSSISVAQSTICMATVLAVVVDRFPTTLRYTNKQSAMLYTDSNFRTLTIAVIMTIARIGAIVGNLIFPIVLSAGCLQSFLTFGSLMICQ